MKLVQVLIPLYDNHGRRIARRHFRDTAEEFTERFGGLTAHTRAPAEGLWKRGSRRQRDDIVIYEVIAARLDRRWWKRQRGLLERRFRQEKVLIRVIDFTEP